MHVQFVDIVETQSVKTAIGNATSGRSTLTMSEAIVDTKSPRMFIPHDASMVVMNERTKTRRLSTQPPTTGVLKTLVIRVLDRNNLAPDLSIDQLQDDVFQDAVSLKSQTNACSYGKLQIQPFEGKTPNNKSIKNGIVNVQMDYAMGKGEEGMDQAAMTAATEQLGDLNDPRFDLVMFCFPPGNNFLAFAYPNTKYSFYENKFCGYVGAQMHEVGHNLGLAHSGQDGEGDYGDISGVMGAVPGKDDLRMCYNAQKNYQLGWYQDKTESINPLDGKRREYILNGISDYKRNKNALVVLRLQQTRLQTDNQVQQDFYVGFNRKSGINSDVAEDGNKVTIIRKESGAPEDYGQSTKIAVLSPGMKHVLQNFNQQGDVSVEFVGIQNGEAKIIVEANNVNGPIDEPFDEGNCQTFTIEVTTDDYPEDNSWIIARTDGWAGAPVASSPKFTEKKKRYVQEVCLPMDTKNDRNYKFTILDTYKDGITGEGSYKAFDDKGKLLFEGAKDFEVKEHIIQVPKDTNQSPTKAPTPVPTKKPTKKPTNKPTEQPTAPPKEPESCENFTIEIKTDNFPEDTSWSILDSSGSKQFSRESFDNKLTVYKTNVCLDLNAEYEFVMVDSHGDGICCSQGKGYYKIKDSNGKAVIDSTDGKFHKKEHSITVGGSNSPPPKQCKDKSGRFKWKSSSKSRSCAFWSKKKCNVTNKFTGLPIWHDCPVSCKRCDDV